MMILERFAIFELMEMDFFKALFLFWQPETLWLTAVEWLFLLIGLAVEWLILKKVEHPLAKWNFPVVTLVPVMLLLDGLHFCMPNINGFGLEILYGFVLLMLVGELLAILIRWLMNKRKKTA